MELCFGGVRQVLEKIVLKTKNIIFVAKKVTDLSNQFLNALDNFHKMLPQNSSTQHSKKLTISSPPKQNISSIWRTHKNAQQISSQICNKVRGQ